MLAMCSNYEARELNDTMGAYDYGCLTAGVIMP
jgi:hypothetical protein